MSDDQQVSDAIQRLRSEPTSSLATLTSYADSILPDSVVPIEYINTCIWTVIDEEGGYDESEEWDSVRERLLSHPKVQAAVAEAKRRNESILKIFERHVQGPLVDDLLHILTTSHYTDDHEDASRLFCALMSHIPQYRARFESANGISVLTYHLATSKQKSKDISCANVIAAYTSKLDSSEERNFRLVEITSVLDSSKITKLVFDLTNSNSEWTNKALAQGVTIEYILQVFQEPGKHDASSIAYGAKALYNLLPTNGVKEKLHALGGPDIITRLWVGGTERDASDALALLLFSLNYEENSSPQKCIKDIISKHLVDKVVPAIGSVGVLSPETRQAVGFIKGIIPLLVNTLIDSTQPTFNHLAAVQGLSWIWRWDAENQPQERSRVAFAMDAHAESFIDTVFLLCDAQPADGLASHLPTSLLFRMTTDPQDKVKVLERARQLIKSPSANRGGKALELLCEEEAERKELIQAGALPFLIRLLSILKSKEDDLQACTNAARALGFIVRASRDELDTICPLLFAPDALEPVFSALALSSSDSRPHAICQVSACELLYDIAVVSPKNARSLIERGVVPQLVNLVTSSARLAVRCAASQTLHALAKDEKGKTALLNEPKAAASLVDLMFYKLTDADCEESDPLAVGVSTPRSIGSEILYRIQDSEEVVEAIRIYLSRAVEAPMQLLLIDCLDSPSWQRNSPTRAFNKAGGAQFCLSVLSDPTVSFDVKASVARFICDCAWHDGAGPELIKAGLIKTSLELIATQQPRYRALGLKLIEFAVGHKQLTGVGEVVKQRQVMDVLIAELKKAPDHRKVQIGEEEPEQSQNKLKQRAIRIISALTGEGKDAQGKRACLGAGVADALKEVQKRPGESEETVELVHECLEHLERV